jgi:hypothetical protein
MIKKIIEVGSMSTDHIICSSQAVKDALSTDPSGAKSTVRLAACPECANRKLRTCICCPDSSQEEELEAPEAEDNPSFEVKNLTIFSRSEQELVETMALMVVFTSSKELFPDSVPRLTIEGGATFSEILSELKEFVRELEKKTDQQSDIQQIAQSLLINDDKVDSCLQINFADKSQRQLFIQHVIDKRVAHYYSFDEDTTEVAEELPQTYAMLGVSVDPLRTAFTRWTSSALTRSDASLFMSTAGVQGEEGLPPEGRPLADEMTGSYSTSDPRNAAAFQK